jgi:hypothetical protein
VERWHKTMRAEFLGIHDRRHATVEELQAALDVWVEGYNTIRPHQALGMRPPIERFQLALHISAGEVPVVDPIPNSAQPGVQPATIRQFSLGREARDTLVFFRRIHQEAIR